jgi:transposase
LEARRLRALGDLKRGLTVTEIARRIGCSHSAVIAWRDAVSRHGEKALKAKPASGRPRRLGALQRLRLLVMLRRGARSWGYETDLWTTSRIASVIEREYHVRFHRAHVGRMLVQLGWSCQKPDRRALQRNENAIEHWKRYRWREIKKKLND